MRWVFLRSTLNFGDKTLDALTRITNGVVHFELGPETRAMLERLFGISDEQGSTDGVGDLVKKGTDALRPGRH